MKLVSLIAFFALAPILAFAAPADTAVEQVQFDWNSDGLIDKAELFPNNESDSVELHVSFGRAGGGFAQPMIARNFAGNSPMIGDPAHIKLNAAHSIVVQSSHIGTGRSKYEAETIVGFRNGQMRVIGYHISRWDSLDPNAGFSCDVNFMAKRAVVNPPASGRRRTIRHNLQAMPIADWSLLPELRGVCPAYD